MNVSQIVGGERFFEEVINAVVNGTDVVSVPEIQEDPSAEDIDEFADGGMLSEEEAEYDREFADGGESEIFEEDDDIFEGDDSLTIGDVAKMIGSMLENYKTKLV